MRFKKLNELLGLIKRKPPDMSLNLHCTTL